MISSVVENDALAERIGASFRLLMQVRMLVATITLLLLPGEQINVSTIALIACLAMLSWIAARHWRLILPRLLRHPLLLGLDVILSFAVLGLGGPLGPFFLYTLASAAMAGLLCRWHGTVIVCSLQVACYYITLGAELDAIRRGGEAVSFQALVGQPAFYPLAGFGGAALRRLLDEHEALVAAHRRAELAAVSAEERARLAREMHDSLAKTLHGIGLAAATLPAWISNDTERAGAEADRIRAATETALREARGLIAGLRGDIVTAPLPDAVRETAEAWVNGRAIALRCHLSSGADLPPPARSEAVAVLAEALENVARHADAHQVDVRLATHSGAVVLSVRDDGRGFAMGREPRSAHYGLRGLYERVERLGGDLTVASAPGTGTTLTAWLPVTGPECGETSYLRGQAPGLFPAEAT